jgi:hypothetical protein
MPAGCELERARVRTIGAEANQVDARQVRTGDEVQQAWCESQVVFGELMAIVCAFAVA